MSRSETCFFRDCISRWLFSYRDSASDTRCSASFTCSSRLTILASIVFIRDNSNPGSISIPCESVLGPLQSTEKVLLELASRLDTSLIVSSDGRGDSSIYSTLLALLLTIPSLQSSPSPAPLFLHSSSPTLPTETCLARELLPVSGLMSKASMELCFLLASFIARRRAASCFNFCSLVSAIPLAICCSSIWRVKNADFAFTPVSCASRSISSCRFRASSSSSARARAAASSRAITSFSADSFSCRMISTSVCFSLIISRAAANCPSILASLTLHTLSLSLPLLSSCLGPQAMLSSRAASRSVSTALASSALECSNCSTVSLISKSAIFFSAARSELVNCLLAARKFSTSDILISCT
mmetsp:Transcript_21199/g.30658  ORF Transcript_21199/g.30658 Transcript_21199/m.30658 type:complete len:356 (+) Transcript_21199:2011-3078(+)